MDAGGRRTFKERLSHSQDNVYNNFPWPETTEAQRAKSERTAREILEVRKRYPQSSLADLYDEIAMPYDLRQAHRANDAAVMRAYGFEVSLSESECVKRLLERYKKLTGQD
ncbi:MAG: methylase [bacterium]|nr:methylase [bacterium]